MNTEAGLITNSRMSEKNTREPQDTDRGTLVRLLGAFSFPLRRYSSPWVLGATVFTWTFFGAFLLWTYSLPPIPPIDLSTITKPSNGLIKSKKTESRFVSSNLSLPACGLCHPKDRILSPEQKVQLLNVAYVPWKIQE